MPLAIPFLLPLTAAGWILLTHSAAALRQIHEEEAFIKGAFEQVLDTYSDKGKSKRLMVRLSYHEEKWITFEETENIQKRIATCYVTTWPQPDELKTEYIQRLKNEQKIVQRLVENYDYDAQ